MTCEGCQARDEKIIRLQEQVIDLQVRLLETRLQETDDIRMASAMNNPMFEVEKKS